MTITRSTPWPPVGASRKGAWSSPGAAPHSRPAPSLRRPASDRGRRRDAAAVGEQELDRELTDQPQAEDCDELAERGGADAHALERDGAEGYEGGSLDREVLRDVRSQVPGTKSNSA